MYLSLTSNLEHIRNDITSVFIHTVIKWRLKIKQQIVTHCIMLEINTGSFAINHECTSGCAHVHTQAYKALLKTGMVSVLELFTTNYTLPSAFFALLPVEAVL